MTNGWNTKKAAIIRRSSGGGAVHWCVGATLLMLAALAFVTPAQALAQTSDVLVSNLGQDPEGRATGRTLISTLPKFSRRAASPWATS